jgi:hypothetical protein
MCCNVISCGGRANDKFLTADSMPGETDRFRICYKGSLESQTAHGLLKFLARAYKGPISLSTSALPRRRKVNHSSAISAFNSADHEHVSAKREATRQQSKATERTGRASKRYQRVPHGQIQN